MNPSYTNEIVLRDMRSFLLPRCVILSVIPSVCLCSLAKLEPEDDGDVAGAAVGAVGHWSSPFEQYGHCWLPRGLSFERALFGASRDSTIITIYAWYLRNVLILESPFS